MELPAYLPASSLRGKRESSYTRLDGTRPPRDRKTARLLNFRFDLVLRFAESLFHFFNGKSVRKPWNNTIEVDVLGCLSVTLAAGKG